MRKRYEKAYLEGKFHAEDNFSEFHRMALQEITRLKAEIERLKCCGSCKWWRWNSPVGRYNCTNGETYENYTPAEKRCPKWEVK